MFGESANPMSAVSPHQRATGQLLIDLKRRGAETVLSDLRQQGCLKARFPRPVMWTEAITLNTSGGVAGGDVMNSTIRAQAGTKITVAAQAAERFYRALPSDPPALLRTRITVECGASLEYLPQDSILFDGCALDRQLEIDIAADAWFLGLESLVFGRAAMGESVGDVRLRDLIRVRIGGRLVLHDAIRREGTPDLDRLAVAGGHTAMATLVLATPGGELPLQQVRDALMADRGAVSVWNGILVARFLASDSAALRQALMAVLAVLRGGRPLPRVWQC
jgi:urease accessory protein